MFEEGQLYSPVTKDEHGSVTVHLGAKATRVQREGGTVSVTLEDGTVIRARTVLCNADPKRALDMLTHVPDDYRARL